MDKLLIIVMLASGSWAAWGKYRLKVFPLKPVYQTPYVILYGRESCGICHGVRRELAGYAVPYVWKIIDDANVQQELYPRMKQAGLDTSRHTLPVVDVNAEIMVSPPAAEIAAKYKASIKNGN